ncbi:MAG: SLBB domain-containing protein [Sinobacteraceae bacterium]|nr:SLBB domain-containing protein [Nevskiaceae bacterium]
MRVMLRRLLWPVMLVLTASFLPQLVGFAQTSGVQSDQIDMFRNLTPEQQDAMLQQLGGGNGGLSGNGSGFGGSSTSGFGISTLDRQGINSQRDNQSNYRNRLPMTSGTEEEQEELKPPALQVMKPFDSVIVEIDYKLGPRALSQSTQAYYLAQGMSPAQIQSLAQNTPGAAATTAVPSPAAAAAAALSSAPGQTATGNPDEITDDDRKVLDNLIVQIRAKNPYVLDAYAQIVLPGFSAISLSGLNDEQATMRLKAEPAFSKLDIRVTRLPLKKTGAKGLKPFGYDLFDRSPSTFAPVTNVPIPADYILGPGDELDVQLFGNQNRYYRITVGRDGRINFPELGPIEVSGKLFSAAKADIEERVSRQIIGVRAAVTLGDTRAIRVFVLGEARAPGSFTISGLGTITSALFAAGGVKRIGSLRNIQLKRQGAMVRQFDLYDLLIHGDTSADAKLLPGDVIFIPPVKATVAIDGEARRPAIYEIKNESSVEDLIHLAGGLTADADRTRVTLTRIDENQHRIALRIDPQSLNAKSTLRDGDLLLVPRLRPTLDSGVQVSGFVYTPGISAYHPGLRLSDVIQSVDDLQPNADQHYVLIRRELPPNRRITVLSADLDAALHAPGSAADVMLMPRDRITVFDLSSTRDHVIQPLMDELRVQSSLRQPTQAVHIDGRVKVPGDYPLETDMRVSDLIRAGGGLADAAYGNKAELTRYEVAKGETRHTQLINIDLDAALRGDAVANVKLQPYDNLSVKEVSEWRAQESVTLSGEVRFPGRYSIRRGETLKSVINRAGGLTEFAFPDGAVFTRTQLRQREQEQMDQLASRMQKDLTILAVQATATSQNGGANAGTALSLGQQLFAQLRSARAVGRLVIDLNRVIKAAPGSSADVSLRNDDELHVPRVQQEVSVIGEVQNATSHLYNADLSRDDYIAMSGGTTRRADHRSIYVVHANGSVVSNSGNRWFEQSNVRIKPGDTIVVPLDAEHLPSLPYWQAVTQILYNVAIAVAAVHAL